MLNAEPERHYIVFPSWAVGFFTFRWETLPGLFADPLKSGYLDANDWAYVRSGILPRTVPPVEFINGPLGGGIIAFKRLEGVNWLPDCILNKEADYHAPPGLGPWTERRHGKLHVSVLELRGDACLRFAGQGLPKPKQYICAASIEHAAEAKDEVYWLVDHKKGRSEIKGLDAIPEWIAPWGLRAERMHTIPTGLREETASWFAAMDRSFCWFRIEGGGTGAALQFARMVYIAMHLRWVAGARMNSMHLVADVEWRPNFRRDLKSK